MGRRILILLPAIFVAMALATVPARADLVLNSTGVADGFTVTNFATGLPSVFGPPFGQGPFGSTVVANGSGGYNVLLEDYANGTLYVFSDTDGQTLGTALQTITGFQAFAEGMANLGGVAYGGNGSVYGTFSSTGAFTPLSIPGLPAPSLGMAADVATGELIAASNSGLIAINPTTNTFRTINGSFGDGVSVSPDGQTVYEEVSGNVVGYNVHTGVQVFTSPLPGGAYSPDGTGTIISSNALNGDLLINDNYGNLYLVNPTLSTITLIGTNGNGAGSERGDFVNPDFTNGTVLMDYSDEVERLSCGTGCGIATPPTNAPEPSSLLLLGSGLLGLIALATWSKRLVPPVAC